MRLGKLIIAVIIMALLGMLLGVFTAWSPVLDQYIAAMAYDESANRFYGEVHLWCRIIYFSIPFITGAFILGSLGLLVSGRKKIALIILLSLLLGPGLLVNAAFKDHWGRPRPYQVLRDGKVYAPVWQHDFNQVNDNSFPSGHASIGFFLGVPFLAYKRRKTAIIVGLIGGGLIGVVRIIQGGHYLSDVVFCGFFVWLAAELVVYMVNKTIREVV